MIVLDTSTTMKYLYFSQSYIYHYLHGLSFLHFLITKHMFLNDCFGYHEIYITNLTYYMNYIISRTLILMFFLITNSHACVRHRFSGSLLLRCFILFNRLNQESTPSLPWVCFLSLGAQSLGVMVCGVASIHEIYQKNKEIIFGE